MQQVYLDDQEKTQLQASLHPLNAVDVSKSQTLDRIVCPSAFLSIEVQSLHD